MNPLRSIIQNYGADPVSAFVFPSEIAASLWMEEALSFLDAGTIDARRFIAWDRFKEDAAAASLPGKQAVSGPIRRLYALNLVRRNADAPTPFFTTIIPSDYAESGEVFSSWIASILPSLACWERRIGARSLQSDAMDSEAADLAFLKKDYEDFLDSLSLFEPSWQEPAFSGKHWHYHILYPEVIEDWHEYERVIIANPAITVHHINDHSSSPTNEAIPNEVFQTVREEMATVALRIEALLRTGVTSDRIAVSVPDIEEERAYLMRELTLRGIPADLRSGEPLGSLPAGRLFTLIQGCVNSNFAFADLKALLLDRLIPWKDRRMAEALIAFGIENHCVSSWKENGKPVDIWSEAFAHPARNLLPHPDLPIWFRELRNSLQGLLRSADFSTLRKKYFAFRERFLDMEQLEEEDDAVFARCVEELKGLIQLTDRYPCLMPHNPWSFFISTLASARYVPQRSSGGVSVFPWRVAAGTPFDYHFVLDASQDRATVLYRELGFLAQDTRARCGLRDSDASLDFFTLYHLCGARFSVSRQAIAGYSTPHGHLMEKKPEAPSLSDPLAAEKAFCFGQGPLPDRLYHSQVSGRNAFMERRVSSRFSYLSSPFGQSVPALTSRITLKHIQDGLVKISQSDLASFAPCNARWFLKHLLGLKQQERDATLPNERNLGLLYHQVLCAVYTRIKKEDTQFNPEHLPEYLEWARAEARGATSQHADFKGPLAEPLIGILANNVVEGVSKIIQKDAEELPFYEPWALEQKYTVATDTLLFQGLVDRISRNSAEETFVIIDYKTKKKHGVAAYTPTRDSDGRPRMDDYQIPMYLFLAEQNLLKQQIDDAWFADITEGKFHRIVSAQGTGRAKPIERRNFTPAMEALAQMSALFNQAVREANFTKPQDLSREDCATCDFTEVCRRIYTVGGCE